MAGSGCPKVRCVAWAHRADGTRKSPRLVRTAVPPAGGCGGGARGPLFPQRLLPKVKAIADTGFLVAFGNRRDRHHAWALDIAQRVTEPLLTCEAVLAETAFHLGSAGLVLGFVREGLVRPAFLLADHVPRLAELAARYADRTPDLADLCLIRLSELHPKHPVI